MRRAERKGKGITLLVPFSPGLSADRDRTWHWLHAYWRAHLPHAQIIVGHDHTHHLAELGHPFSKTAAVNDAARHARGDIIVIIDADAYVSHKLITHCADEIRHAIHHHRKLWFVPYRRFYRLSEETTEKVLESDPRHPWHVEDPPLPIDLDPHQKKHQPRYGHHYGAMIMIMPRRAFEEVGGMDPRFNGWGGEDISFMRCVDTIYNPHKTVNASVFHLYHGTIGKGVNRQWLGQVKRMPFAKLGRRYEVAYGDRARMLRLNREWREHRLDIGIGEVVRHTP